VERESLLKEKNEREGCEGQKESREVKKTQGGEEFFRGGSYQKSLVRVGNPRAPRET